MSQTLRPLRYRKKRIKNKNIIRIQAQNIRISCHKMVLHVQTFTKRVFLTIIEGNRPYNSNNQRVYIKIMIIISYHW